MTTKSGAISSENQNRFEKNPALTFLIVFILGVISLFLLDFLLAALFLGHWTPKVAGQVFPNSYYHHEHGVMPMDSVFVKWGTGGYTDSSNSLGFKDAYPRVIPLNTKLERILLLGDSFVEGLGVPYQDTFVRFFQEHLDKKRYEVLNAGVTSYSPRIYYLKLKYLLETVRLKIDYLIVFIDISDIQDEIVYKKYSPKDPTVLRKFTWFMFNHSFIFNTLYSRFPIFQTTIRKFLDFKLMSNYYMFGDYDFQKNYYADRDRWLYENNIYKIWGENGLKLASANMDNLLSLCKQWNLKPMIVIYPWPEEINQNNVQSRMRVFWSQYAKERQLPILDFYKVFFEDPLIINPLDYFIKGDIHWNIKGHHLIADELFKFWQKLY